MQFYFLHFKDRERCIIYIVYCNSIGPLFKAHEASTLVGSFLESVYQICIYFAYQLVA